MERTDQELREMLDRISSERATMKPGEYPEEQPIPAPAPDELEAKLRHQHETVGVTPELRAAKEAYDAALPDELEVVAWDRLRDLIGEYFDLGYAEGVVQRTVDTMADDAQRTLSEIEAIISQAHSTIAALRAERDELLYLHSERDQGDKIINERLAALEDGVKAVVIERDSWRRVAERLEGEKQSAEAEVKRLTEDNEALRAPEAGLGQSFGSAVVWHLREMYPDAFKAIGASARRSLRNFINNRADRVERELEAVEAERDALRKALEQIIQIDRREKRTCVEFDPAGSTYEIEDVDGPAAIIARKAMEGGE